MVEEFFVPEDADKSVKYAALLPQLEALVEAETDWLANCANVMAALHATFGFLWVGVYRVINNSVKEELVLGPFQGPLACTRIAYGKGVCGTAWKEKRTLLVPDVDLFPGHIACSSLSRSEIVVPVIRGDKVIAVLDVDSETLSSFDTTDQYYLEKVAHLLSLIMP